MKDPVAWYDKHASTVASQYESVKLHNPKENDQRSDAKKISVPK
jgi:hypothetical protein